MKFTKALFALALVACSTVANAQLIYGLGINQGGIIGTNTNNSAPAGNVGEFASGVVTSGAAVAAAATTVSKNVTSVSLTAGDWEVSGVCNFVMTGLTATVISCGLGVVTDTQLTAAGGSGVGSDPLAINTATFGTTLTGTTQQRTNPVRVSLSATTTIFLVANLTYSAGSATQYGSVSARRMR